MADTTAQHIAARDDADLRARLIAAAEQKHIPNPEQFVQANMGNLISTKITGDTTLTAIHAYASGVREAAVAALPLPAGLDPAALTDPQLLETIHAVWSPPSAA